jgi:Zn-dependent protease
MNKGRGAFRIFQAFGINVWIHWSWFLVAAYELETRKSAYRSPAWNIAEYLALFCIVLLHEFGHALACKQTGGQANEIIL